MIKGHVRQIKKLLSSGTSIIEIEIPVEAHIAATMVLDGRDVYVDDVGNHDAGDLDQPYGVITFGTRPEFAPRETDDSAPGCDDLEDPAPYETVAIEAIGKVVRQLEPKPPKEWGELKRSAQAAILGSERAFQIFMDAMDAENAKLAIYSRIGVDSRARLDDPEVAPAWDQLVKRYREIQQFIQIREENLEEGVLS